jgi:two-component system, OmpR family, sensor histidine kinase TctE
MLPLALTWLCGTAVAVGIAAYFAQQAFDRSLLDDAYVVASNVHLREGRLELAFTPRELRTVLFDQEEVLMLTVLQPDGTRIAGNAQLQAQRPAEGSAYRFDDRVLEGRMLRTVTLVREQPSPFHVVVAQTTHSRTLLMRRMLMYSIAPQALLLLLLAIWLRRAITEDLRPLQGLQQALHSRDAHDLRAVPEVATTRDVQELAAAVNSLLHRLEQSVSAQREFAGNVAHELRTPLAGIRALADYGLAQKAPQAWRAQLESIMRSEARASRMVDQLLALALAGEARAGIRLAPVVLDGMVADAVMRFLPRADAQGTDLGARGADEGTTVAGDATLIEAVLNNLIDNALRYGKDAQGACPSVTVSIEQDAGHTILCVVDAGAGMPPGMQEKLLQRWAQGDSGLLLGEGSGLGLSIVSQYARLMRARLVLQAGPQGRGLAASVYFPR